MSMNHAVAGMRLGVAQAGIKMADHDDVVLDIDVGDVARRLGGDAEPSTLADGVVGDAIVLADGDAFGGLDVACG